MNLCHRKKEGEISLYKLKKGNKPEQKTCRLKSCGHIGHFSSLPSSLYKIANWSKSINQEKKKGKITDKYTQRKKAISASKWSFFLNDFFNPVNENMKSDLLSTMPFGRRKK